MLCITAGWLRPFLDCIDLFKKELCMFCITITENNQIEKSRFMDIFFIR